MALKEEQFAAQVAIMKKDDTKVALYLKATERLGKEMVKLVSAIRCIGLGRSMLGSIADAEIAGVVSDAVGVTKLVTVTLLNGISMAFAPQKSSRMGLGLRRKVKKVKAEEGIQEFQQVGVESLRGLRNKGDEEMRVVLEKMQNLEGCVCRIESYSEKVFRSLISTRVSLLNVLTQ